MRTTAILIASLALSACNVTSERHHEGNLVAQQVAATTAASGWRVDCIGDQFTATTRCFAGTFGSNRRPFQVYYLGKRGPLIQAGTNDFPGRTASIRVNDGPVVDAINGNAVVKNLHAGGTAYVQYHVWPTGPERMTVNLSGFSDAHSRLLEKIGR